MTDLIKRILREEIETKKEAIKSMIKKSGLETAARVMGGINNIIDIVTICIHS
jgi:protein-arginine kinase activator protein McsA